MNIPYREGNLSRLGKGSAFFNQLSTQDTCGGYTGISFGCAQFESPRSNEEDYQTYFREVFESYKDPKIYEYTHVQGNDGSFGEQNCIEEISSQEMLDMDDRDEHSND